MYHGLLLKIKEELKMTEQEARAKYPNVAKLSDLVSQQDNQMQCAMLLLIAAAAIMFSSQEIGPGNPQA